MSASSYKDIQENDVRLRLFYLYRILEQYTDEEHPLTTNQLRKLIEEKHGILMHRTTMYSDIELLQKAGVFIHCYRAKANQYYLESRKFEISELKLLIDAVESSRFMTEEQSKRLVEKLTSLTSATSADKLKRNLHVSGRVKAVNKQIFYIVDAINEEIDSGLKISFQYTEYNNKKRKVLRHGGEVYIVSPYALIWDGDYYYVVGFSERRGIIQNFRLDRIAKSPMILNEPAKPAPDDFSLKKYFESVFRMFSADEQVPVELLCETFIMKAIIDQFGAKVQTEEIDDNHFKATVSVCPSPTFYQWVFGWNGAMKILGPENILEEYRAMCRKGLED